MQRWKASLGLNAGEPIAEPNDPRKCIIKSLSLQVEGRPDVVIDLSTAGSVEDLKNKPFKIKEGSKFHIKASFQVHHEVLSGLKYLQVVKRKGIRVSKDEEMLGSFPPSTNIKPIYEKICKLPGLFSFVGLS
jgi:Rho GDP-dissociation inhibitor